MRTKGSACFSEYFKAQFFDEISLCWCDIQKAYPTAEMAAKEFTKDKKWRIMVITEKGRRPLV